MKFSKIWNDDWLAGTHPLTPEERGVFITLVCHFVNKDYVVPDNDRYLARMCNTTTRTYRRIKNTLIDGIFIEIIDGMVFIERAKNQAENDRNFASTQALKATKRWALEKAKKQAKLLKNNKTQTDPAYTNDIPEPMPEDMPPSPSPSMSDNSLKTRARGGAKASDLKKSGGEAKKKGNEKAKPTSAELLANCRKENPNFVSSPCLENCQKEFPAMNCENLIPDFNVMNVNTTLSDPDAAFIGFCRNRYNSLNLPEWQK